MVLSEQCCRCGKPIPVDEYVVNWATCDYCWNREWARYRILRGFWRDLWLGAVEAWQRWRGTYIADPFIDGEEGVSRRAGGSGRSREEGPRG